MIANISASRADEAKLSVRYAVARYAKQFDITRFKHRYARNHFVFNTFGRAPTLIIGMRICVLQLARVMVVPQARDNYERKRLVVQRHVCSILALAAVHASIEMMDGHRIYVSFEISSIVPTFVPSLASVVYFSLCVVGRMFRLSRFANGNISFFFFLFP